MDKITLDTSKQTAHQMWCDALCEQIVRYVLPDSIANGKAFFQTSKVSQQKRTQEACVAVVAVETTRLRVQVDGMVALLESTTTRRREIHAEYEATPFFRFRKRQVLLQQHKDQGILQEAYKTAVGILTNTPPPVIEMPKIHAEEMAPMHVSHNPCDTCGGTGSIKLEAGVPANCSHCEGTGEEPEEGGVDA